MAAVMKDLKLEAEFTQAMRDAIAESIRLGHNPIRMIEMLRLASGSVVAKKLVPTTHIHAGLKQMKKLGRMDLAMESIMMEPRFQPLFTATDLTWAMWRLTQV